MGHVLDFGEIDRTLVERVGGKGAHLGELSRLAGVRVPPGFVVATDAYRAAVRAAPSLDAGVEALSRLAPDDGDAIRARSAELRRMVEGLAVPSDVAAAIAAALARLGDDAPWAVRSSATAEDSPTASFAGQQDSFLNVVGPAAVVRHVRRCWASLFTERAVTYRLRNGLDHRAAGMAVVVQRMVAARAAGVLFTADPVSGDRRVVAVEAALGLGEALVSGVATPDVYRVRDGRIVERAIAAKPVAVHARPGGGTETRPVDPARQAAPALADEEVLRLAELGRRIERHLGRPQDVEWCLASDGLHVVQSRPITTLFPIPEAPDGERHVYISVGHQQMMTDAMTPLGLSVWQMTTPRPMAEAGGRLFVDVTDALSAPASRAALLDMLGRSDPLIGDALRRVVDRADFLRPRPDDPALSPVRASPQEVAALKADPAIVAELVARVERSVATLRAEIDRHRGPALLDFIRADVAELRRLLFDPQSHRATMAGIEATWWLNERLAAWLGEPGAADALAQSAPGNVTSEMGLALLDVADAIRPHAAVVAFLEGGVDNGFLDRLPAVPGGDAAAAAIRGWLDRYGMRGVGEIDVARPRWSERPTLLLPILLANVRGFEPGAGRRRFAEGLRRARETERAVLARLRALPDGERKAEETRRTIDRLRTFIGYREFPKYGMICRYALYKRALLAEADRLVAAGVLDARDDAFLLRFDELHEVVRTARADRRLIERRREELRWFRTLTPPRVLTSDGEAVAGAYRRAELPAGALVGLPVSAGTVEGRARVVLDIARADLAPGDILVTAFTDPSWTPAFVAIAGLVTEVGGLMTHGAVIAREYGIPAVVGVEGATRRIRDGARIRVHGADGYVELLG